MGNEAAKLAAPDDAERYRDALSGVGEVNADPARCALHANSLRLVCAHADAPAP